MSTFIVECERNTWLAAGLDRMSEDESRQFCARIFSRTLGGAGLVANRSLWRNFPKVWNERWSHRNRVLIGDALHTAHFSIGSGTRLALEDAIALADALRVGATLEDALQTYEDQRKPIARKIVDAANRSAAWYETFGARMGEKIAAVGSLEAVKDRLPANADLHDLQGRTLIPAFIDPHGHFPDSGFIDLFRVDLSPPPRGNCTCLADSLHLLRAKADAMPAGEWIMEPTASISALASTATTSTSSSRLRLNIF